MLCQLSYGGSCCAGLTRRRKLYQSLSSADDHPRPGAAAHQDQRRFSRTAPFPDRLAAYIA